MTAFDAAPQVFLCNCIGQPTIRPMRAAAVALGFALSTGVMLAQSSGSRVAMTSDGQPDLQGVWVNNTITPFERPQELADKEFLSDDELAVLNSAPPVSSGTATSLSVTSSS